MRSLWFAIAGLLALCTAVPVQAQQGARIGFIDSQAVLLEAPGAQEAQAEFDRQTERLSQEVAAMEAELDQLVADYQAQQATLLANVRQAREAEIMQRNERYQARVQEMDGELNLSRQNLIEPILMQMTAAIEAIREEGGYAMIFDVQGQAIVAADPALDLTPEVLRRLRAQAGVTQP